MTTNGRIPADVRFRVVSKRPESAEGAGRLSPGVSCRRPLVCTAAALVICLFVGTRAAAEPFTENFPLPDIPGFDTPAEPFISGAGDLDEIWNVVEERRDEIHSATYERLWLNVRRAREAVETCERHVREFLRAHRRFESDLEDLLERRREFDRRIDEVNRMGTVDDQAHFERRIAPLRALYAPLRKQYGELGDRARGFETWMENDLEPEGRRAGQTLRSAFTEVAELIEQMRRYPVIGAAGAVSGSVTAQSLWPGSAVRVMRSGMKVYFGDDVSTGPAGRMQVLLLDETVFTVGPDTELTLDEFVYDPFSETGKITASISKGLIRFVSGRIAAKTPSDVRIKGPVGTLGIRGTDFVVEVDDDGRTRIDVLEGLVEFTSSGDGSSALIREGEQLWVDADGAMAGKREIDVDEVQQRWKAVGTSEPAADAVSPPFESRHYVILGIALLIVLVAWAKLSGWHLLPMGSLALLFLVCVEFTGRFSVEGWWFWWWFVCASAGYVLYYLLVLLALGIADELTRALRRDWPVPIGLGAIATAGGLVFAFDGMERLFHYLAQFVYPHLWFVLQPSRLGPSPNDEATMFAAWMTIGLGLLLAIGGVATVMGSLQKRPREDVDLRRTPLHRAAYFGRHKVVQRLLNKKADTAATDRDGSTPLHLATKWDHKDVVALLLANGANVRATTHTGRTPLHEAAFDGREASARLLLAYGAKVNARDAEGKTPLHLAVAMDTKVVGLLLHNGANVNAKAKTGWTPLHTAAFSSEPELAEVLLTHGARTNAKDDEGWTPLHAAVGYEDVVKVLLAHGANAFARDKKGRTPLDRARDLDQEGTARLLSPGWADVMAARDGESAGRGSTDDTEREKSTHERPGRSLEDHSEECDHELEEGRDDIEDVRPVEEPRCPVCSSAFGELRTSRCPNCRDVVHRACLSKATVPGGRLCDRCLRERTDSVDWTEPVAVSPSAPERPSGNATCDGCDRSFDILPVEEAQDVKVIDIVKGMALPFWCPSCDDLTCTDCMAREQGSELDGPVMLSKTCARCGGSRELLLTDELAGL